MDRKRVFFLTTTLVIFWLVGVFLLRYMGLTGSRFINDNFDRTVYFSHGSWIVDNTVPYRDFVSEYPQIPTYFFAVPYLVLSILKPMDQVGYWAYSSAFSLSMLAFLFITIYVLYISLPNRKDLAFLLLLPGYLYFIYNRFDILPAVLTLIGFILLKEGKTILTAILLGIATLTKWYPALLFLVIILYQYNQTKKIPYRMLVSYVISCSLIILPTIVTGGIDAVLVPYRFHLSRELEQVAFPTLIDKFLSIFSINTSPFFLLIFLILQFSPVLIIPFLKIDSPSRVLLSFNLIIASFILFSRVYSPQWLLWLIPFLILSSDKFEDILWIFIGGIANYIAFPLVYDAYGPQSFPMIIMGVWQIILLIRVVIDSLTKLLKNHSMVHVELA